MIISELSRLEVGGLTPLTSTDYPGCLAAVVFCQGCSWRCGYCHNPHLIPRLDPDTLERTGQLGWSDVMSFLRRRQGLLDAVVFSGGEPTLQHALQSAVCEVRDLGFKIGLHTGGTYPAHLAAVLPLLSWVGMDIKAAFEDYDSVTGTPKSGEKAWASAQLLLDSGVACEFRTTVHPLFHTQDSLLRLAEELCDLGARHYVLQEFRPQGCADELVSTYPTQELLDKTFCDRVAAMFETFSIRRA